MPTITLTITNISRIDPEGALLNWARIERDELGTGWYRTQPFYKPELTGYRESLPAPTLDEIELGNRVGGIVNKMAMLEVERADALRFFYGAYPGARSHSKPERVQMFHTRHGIKKRDFYRLKDEGKRIVEGALNYGG